MFWSFFKHKNANFSLDEKIYKTEPIIKMLLEEISSVMFFSNVCHRFIIEMNFIIKFFEFSILIWNVFSWYCGWGFIWNFWVKWKFLYDTLFFNFVIFIALYNRPWMSLKFPFKLLLGARILIGAFCRL